MVDAVRIVVDQQIQCGAGVAHIDVTVSAAGQVEDQREFVVVVPSSRTSEISIRIDDQAN